MWSGSSILQMAAFKLLNSLIFYFGAPEWTILEPRCYWPKPRRPVTSKQPWKQWQTST
jgi:hypothetical protein